MKGGEGVNWSCFAQVLPSRVSHFSWLGCSLALDMIHPRVEVSLWEPFHVAIFSFASVTIDFGLNNIFKKALRGIINQEGALLLYINL